MYSVHSSGYTRNTVGIQRNTAEYKCILFIRQDTQGIQLEYNRIQRVVLYSVGVRRIHHRYVEKLAEYVADRRIPVLGMPSYLPCSPSSRSLASSSSLEPGSATGARCRAGGGRSVFPPFMAAVFDAPVCRRPRT